MDKRLDQLSIVAVVLGGLAVIIALIQGINFLSIPLGLSGMILGGYVRKRTQNFGLATAGIVVSLVGMVMGVFFYLVILLSILTSL